MIGTARAAESHGSGASRTLLAAAGIGGVYAALAVVAFLTAPRLGAEHWPLKHDQVGYYAYLPALLHDGGLSFEWASGPMWEDFVRGGFAGFRPHETTGRPINSYTPGVALLQLPFFAAGHAVAAAVGAPRDGFSWPYRLLTTLGGVVYATLGLAALALALGGHFPPGIVLGVVAILGLGTNLLYYATFEPLMSHAHSFFALGVALWATLAWGERPRLRTAIILGLAVGLAVGIRPTNALFAPVPVLYALARRGRAQVRPLLIHTAAGAVAALVGMLPLLAYWRFASGAWLTNPYGGGTFYWADPEIGRLLWSYRKGWFIYTPVMLAVLPGLALAHRYARGLTVPLAAYFVSAVYVAASWWCWWYGGSFGMRALIEVSAPLSVALAAFLTWSSEGPTRLRIVGGVLALLVALNVFQTYQYVQTYIRWDGMSRASYWAVFGRPSIPRPELAAIHRELSEDGQRAPRVDR